MRKIAVLVALAPVLWILTAPVSPRAEPAASRVHRIGVLSSGFAPVNPREATLELLRKGLRELGYIEGQNVLINWRWAEGMYDQLPPLAAELVHLKVDVIVTDAAPAVRAARAATSTIPIVMTLSDDPVGTGLVASLARPGGNVTGLSFLSSELSGKRLELLKETIARGPRIGILWNASNPSAALQVRATEAAARTLGLELQELAVRDPNEFDSAFSAMSIRQIGALFVVDDPMFVDYHNRIADLAARSRLPAMFGFREFVTAGGLMSYGPDAADMFRRSAAFVDRILKGAKPGELPLEQPTRFELVLNLKTAKALGLTIPQSVLVRADEVIR